MFRRTLAFALLALAGCATPPNEQIVPFTQEQTQAFFARARPPQAFGLTVYATDNGPVFAGSSRLHPGDYALRPFVQKGNPTAPVIHVTARGENDFTALLDTSSSENWVEPVTAVRMGFVALAGPNPYEAKAAHVYDEIGGYAGLVHQVVMDKLHVENIVFYARAAFGPLGPPARWLTDPPPQMALGMSFLRAFSYVQMDFAQSRAIFASTATFRRPSDATLVASMPMKDVRGVLGVEGTMDGEPMTFLLDTGGDFELMLNEPPEPTVRRLSIGDLVFPPDVTVVAGMDQGLGETSFPRIGRRLLSRFCVTFDFRNKVVYFERPAGGA